jgi:hypothetical protein
MAKQTQPALKPVLLPSSQNDKKWHAVLSAFFHNAGLLETIRGFEADLLVLSRAQHERLPVALKQLADEVGPGLWSLEGLGLMVACPVRGTEGGGL